MEVQEKSMSKKEGSSMLSFLEKKFLDWTVPKVPHFIETYHLTLLTFLWSGMIVLFSYLARQNIQWLWLVSGALLLQYITDLLDGAVGRFRKTGLVRWGYYMDHFLDYVFLGSIMVGYSLLLPDKFKFQILLVFFVFSAFMVNSFLAFTATGKFKIYYLGIGPSEIRILFVLINTLLIYFGKTYMAPALPFVLGFSIMGLFFVVYKTQKKIWKKDLG